MKYSIYLLLLHVQVLTSLEIFCNSKGSILVLPQRLYRISLKNPPNQNFFVIGKEKSEPILSYKSGTWTSSLDAYSLTSYEFRLPYYYIISGTAATSVFFSVCSFQSLNDTSLLLPPAEVNKTCDSDCNKNKGQCMLNECWCESGYFGRSCGLIYHEILSDYSKTFKVRRFSLTFFYSTTNNEIKFEDKKNSSHIFWSKDFLPSFFSFKNYEKLDFTKSNLKGNYLTVFCSSENGCSFSIKSKNSDDLFYFYVIGLPCIFFIAFIVIGIFVRFKVRRCRKNQDVGGINKLGIEMIAPLKKIGRTGDGCSICLNDFEENEEVRVIDICKHLFHSECIEEWFRLKASCPNCKLNFK